MTGTYRRKNGIQREILLVSASTFTIALAFPAQAQTTDQLTESASATTPIEQEAEEIVVTATRVYREGFDAPTPTTVLGGVELRQKGVPNLLDVLNETPSFRGSFAPGTSPYNTRNVGASFADLRGLGASRTLILVDGRRVVPDQANGLVDLNIVPAELIERVEIVTGGASADWGSDAVAGVVNIILDHDLEGFKANLQGGISQRGDGQELKAALAWGTHFADDRGHFQIGGEIVDNNGILAQSARKWASRGSQIIANPDTSPGQPQMLVIEDARLRFATEGGAIVGPQGIQFGPGGTLLPFTSGALGSGFGFYEVGGSGTHVAQDSSITVPMTRQAAYGRLSYEFSPAFRAVAEGSYSHRTTNNDLGPSINVIGLGNTFTIKAGNPFISPALAAAGVTAPFSLGRVNRDFGLIQQEFESETYRGVIGFDGKIGGKWRWNAYYQYGQTNFDVAIRNNALNANLALAADAVTDVAGVLGAPGAPVCAARLAAPASTNPLIANCVPINLFGSGSPSAAAIDYVTGDGEVSTAYKQHVLSGTLQGDPFSTWAGPVSVAIGAEHRRDKVGGTTDPLSAASAFFTGNDKATNGKYNVTEGFVSVVVPLLRDAPMARSLDFAGAVRVTDYSTSGTVTTWKAGLTWEVFDGFRLRGTRSRDIRAPNLGELFSGQTRGFGTVRDTPNGGAVISVIQARGGNPNLVPEKADTLTLGAVYEPSWAPGLRMAVDYFDVDIRDAIGTPPNGRQDIFDRCAAGEAEFCALIDRSETPPVVSLTFVNLQSLRTSGVDFELGYNSAMNLFGSGQEQLSLRLLGTYVDKLVLNNGVVSRDLAGDIGTDAGGLPHWRVNARATYEAGPILGYLQGRYIGGGNYTSSLFTLDDNTIPSVFYMDASLQFTVFERDDGSRFQFYGTISNLLDKDPPVNPTSFFTPFATNPQLYDVVGRYFRFGARFSF